MYCPECGKELNEGEICTCPETGTQKTDPTEDPPGGRKVSADEISKHAKNFFRNIQSLLKNPSEEISAQASQSTLVSSFQYIGVKAVCAALAVLFILLQVDNMTMGLVKTSKLQPMLLVIVLSLVIDAAYAGALLAVSQIFKEKLDKETAFFLIGIKSIPEGAGILVGGLLTIISLKLGLLVMGIGFAVGIVLLIEGFTATTFWSGNKKIYGLCSAFAAFMVINWIAFSVSFSKIFSIMGSSISRSLF